MVKKLKFHKTERYPLNLDHPLRVTFASEIMVRAHTILNEKGPMRASTLGWELWGETTEHPDRGDGSHGHNKFCRAAGKILRRLRDMGRVRMETDGYGILWRAM